MHDALHALTRGKSGQPMPEDEDEYHELLEWIDEVMLDSEKVFAEKVTDDFGAATSTRDLKVLTMQGLLSPQWVTCMLIGIM